ncbi:hypothetical protein [Neobacillus vireti]|uniref:hypothetical protein n=1 Tax=Neobacillus vireti TaxID=220686 RepID=UPI002FFD9702
MWRIGEGMIDNLKDISNNLEDAKSEIADYDHDGVISFHYTSLEKKYQELYEEDQGDGSGGILQCIRNQKARRTVRDQ